jgi:hypothetical protein
MGCCGAAPARGHARRFGVGDVEFKPRDLGSDTGTGRTERRAQDAMKGRCLASLGMTGILTGQKKSKPPAGRRRYGELPVHEALGEGVVAGADAHGVMPGDGEGPPRKTAENGLAEGEGQDIALFGEEQAHAEAADECDGNEDWVGPVKRAEDQTRECGGDDWVFLAVRVGIES